MKSRDLTLLFNNFAHFVLSLCETCKKKWESLFSRGFAQYQVCRIFFFFTSCKLNQAELNNVFPILFPNIFCLWIAILKYPSSKDILKNVTY